MCDDGGGMQLQFLKYLAVAYVGFCTGWVRATTILAAVITILDLLWPKKYFGDVYMFGIWSS